MRLTLVGVMAVAAFLISVGLLIYVLKKEWPDQGKQVPQSPTPRVF